MIMVLIIAFCFWYGGYAFKNPEKVWEYQHFLTVKDGTPTLFSIYFIDHDCHRHGIPFY